MKKLNVFLCALLIAAAAVSCGDNNETSIEESSSSSMSEISADESSEKNTVAPESVGFEGMTPIYGDSVADGEYSINVDSSSSMFKIVECKLKVSGGKMTADMVMSGTGYEKLFIGTSDEAENAAESDFIAYTENSEGQNVFTLPVEALDSVIDCAAFSKRKKLWYDRQLVFRADSLSGDALSDSGAVTAADLGLADGDYTADVELSGGSGKAKIDSPAKITVNGDTVTAEIRWGSNNYDYMIVEGEKYLPVSMDEISVFEIPINGFDHKINISADTTAMSTPHEIEYSLYFDSSTITPANAE